MLEIIKKAFTQRDTRNKIFFTLFILLLYRIGAYIPVPGMPFHAFADAFNESSSAAAVAILDLFSGGALSNFSIFALGIMPYITASIIMQLMAGVIPKVEQWAKEGVAGRKKITRITRWLTLVLGLLNSIGYLLLFKSTQYGVIFSNDVPGILNEIMVVFALMVGVSLIMWMGELITQKGIGNGMSVIIFTSIVAGIPPAIVQSIILGGTTPSTIALTIAIVIAVVVVIPLIVFIERAQRRIPIRYARSGSSMVGARSQRTTYFPIKVNAYGVIAIIFASCLLYFPTQVSAFFGWQWLTDFANVVSTGPVSWMLDAALIIFFCYFYAAIAFRTDDIAENLARQNGIIPGIAPGRKTSEYLRKVSTYLTLPGAIYVAIIAVGTSILFYFTGNQLIQAFGGTSILIMIGVGLDMMARVESQVKIGSQEYLFRP